MAKIREILISTDAQETRVAVTEERRLEEFYVERASDTRMVGSIYKGRVTSIVPGIGATFVDIGLGKNGFLYVSDIVEPKPEEETILEGEPAERNQPSHAAHHRRSRIEDLVKVNQEILVQVVKEPFGTKGARLTTHLGLPGRYMVLMCNDARMGISKRISDPQERSRLREILSKLRFHGLPTRFRAMISRGKREEILGNPGLKGSLRYSFEALLDGYDYLTGQLKKFRERVLLLAASKDYARSVGILRSIPGVGLLTALSWLLELPEMEAFESNEKLGSYLGLTSSEYSSGENRRQGRITRCGNNRIRGLLVQCAWRTIGGDPVMGKFYERIKRRRGGNRAIVAVARKLSGRMRTILLKGESYAVGLVQ